jgi:4-hydroxybenzoate polyprenyltransferase
METLTEERPPAPRVGESPPSQATRSKPLALLVAMRPREWIKNLLVFAGLLFSGKLDEGAQVLDATAAFAAFCAVSSAGYLFNDLRDAVHDRQHPLKRLRPVASGELSPSAARVSAAVLAAIGIGVALIAVSAELAGLVALYGVITAAYSLILKQLVILDVMTIASLFLLRVVAGAVAVEAHASEWLLLCTAMLALFLGFTKRRQEAMSANAVPALSTSGELERAPAIAEGPGAGAGSRVTRPVLEHYSLAFLDQMVAMVTAAAIISYAIYAVNSPLIGSRMLATAPSVLYGIFRYLYLIYDRGDTRPTSVILTRDPGMIFAAVSWVAAALAMLYVFD